MLSWTIGAVKVTRIVELEMPVPYSTSRPFLVEATPEALREHAWLFPDFVTVEGHLRFSIHALLVEAPGIRLVVDTCVGNDRPRRHDRWVALATEFLKSFADAGWTREGVDAVVCTHLHVDHVGWNTMLVDGAWVPTFPKARYLIGRAEYRALARRGGRGAADPRRLRTAHLRRRPGRARRHGPPDLTRAAPGPDPGPHTGTRQRGDRIPRASGP